MSIRTTKKLVLIGTADGAEKASRCCVDKAIPPRQELMNAS